MKPCRVHITGASGSGVTTLGRALASAWSVPCHDTDDYYWEPSEPPFVVKRDQAERLRLMGRLFLPRGAWVLSGSLIGWGDTLIQHFDLVVFLRLAPAARLKRLSAREYQRYGHQALAPGGERHRQFGAFIAWAAAYDQPGFSGRSLERHQAWLAKLPCPVLELDGATPTERLVSRIIELGDRETAGAPG